MTGRGKGPGKNRRKWKKLQAEKIAVPKMTPPKKQAKPKDSSDTVKPKDSAGRKRRGADAIALANGSENVRSSKRARLQMIPYQTPESISKILEITAMFSIPANSIPADKPETKAKVVRRNSKTVNDVSTPIPVVPPVLPKKQYPKAGPKATKTAATKVAAVAAKKVKEVVKKNLNSTKGKSTITKIMKGKVTTPALVKKTKSISKKTTDSPVDDKSIVVPLKKRALKKTVITSTSADLDSIIEDVITSVCAPKKKSTKKALQPKLFVTEYTKDPTFEMNETIPHVSTLAHSRLLIRAINLHDNKLLKNLVQDKKSICAFTVPRSLNIHRDAFSYALEKQNLEAIQLLMDGKLTENLAPVPDVILSEEKTGHNSVMMFGHAMRGVTVGRGGKEGNNALLKDKNIYQSCQNDKAVTFINYTVVKDILGFGLRWSMIQKLNSLYPDQYIFSNVFNSVVYAVRAGYNQLAGEIVKEALTRDGFGFNLLFQEVLLNTTEPLTPFKSVSVAKKVNLNDRITPIHCAAINPNPAYLIALLNSRPDYSIQDMQMWSAIHYAAVCTGTGPLQTLLARGISTLQMNKAGDTPLHLAATLGRVANIKLILENEKENKDEGGPDVPKDIAGSLVQRLNKVGQTALHKAAEAGHAEVVKILLNAGADAEKFTPARYDKLTPFMFAAQRGHLDVLKVLVQHGVKVDNIDHKGRTALAHAVIDGQGHVVSYLLRLGSNHMAKDSSGNTLVHYAAAYGWYFCLKLLIEAGCPPNEPNDWKMTPLAISFMKGHMGLVEFILKQSGVDINSRVNDSTGVTLLLQAIASKPTSEFYSRIKFLLDDQKADCNIVDFEDNNALHYLVSTEEREKSDDRNYENSEVQKFVFQVLKLLWDRKCNPCALNSNDESPVSLAVKHGCFSLLNKFFDLGCPLPEEADKEGNTVLHIMVSQAQTDHASNICRRWAKDPKKLDILKKMANVYNTSGYTPLLWLLHRVPSISDVHCVKNVTEYISFLVNTLESDVKAADRKEKSKESVLHLASQVSYAEEALRIILTMRPNLEILNHSLKTPLASAIINGKEKAARMLLNAGANVNFKLENGDSLLLLQAVDQSKSFSLIPLMIEKGANIHEVNKDTKNTVLHYICRKPHLPYAVESVKKLIHKKIDINAINKDGRTALHLAVNFRGGETDAIYDIEDVLIESKAKLNIRDIRGRIPLHLVFVKIGKYSDRTFMDPIELVTTLVRAMKDSIPNYLEEIKSADEFGCTPLHYGAFRGATISCSYLLMEMKGNVDIRDKNGNTPFGLAVFNGHEGCALQFQQQGANFNFILNSSLAEEKASDKSDIPWKWKCVKMGDEERQKKKLEKQKYPILQEVVRKDWQGILHLMLEKLNNSGAGASLAIAAAINTNRLKLTRKLVSRARSSELFVSGGETLLHILAKAEDINDNDRDLIERIVQILIAKGVAHSALDKSQSTALVHAATNRNYILCDLLGELSITMNKHTAFKYVDKFGRTPFTALFWKINGKTEFSKELKLWAESLLAQGALANIGCRYPVIVHPFPGVRYLKCETQVNFSSLKYSPLMMGVIVGNYSIVKWLLTLKSSTIVDVNFQDDEGRTALMHAVRANDIKMVQLILNPKTYDYTKDIHPWQRKSSKFHYRNHLSLDLQDRKGWTVMDHVVAVHEGNFCYANSDAILRILYSAGAPINKKSGDGISPLDRAIKMKRIRLVDSMEELLGLSKDRRTKFSKVSDELFSIDISSSSSCYSIITNYATDCAEMTKIVMDQDENKISDGDLNTIEPDSLVTKDGNTEQLRVLFDSEQKMFFSCCLTKVDICYGTYGIYNFYKMQLLRQERGKQLIVLFTCWGRVGDDGQYQKTPFVSEEEAIKEFKKIFRSKSGNAWENLEAFAPLPKKYRLVDLQTKKVKKPNQVKIDFDKLSDTDSRKTSNLSPSLVKLMKILCLVHKTDIKFTDFVEEYGNQLPFGSLTFETLKKGEALLEEIEALIKKRDESEKQGGFSSTSQITFMESVLKPCEEFYSLIPVYGFAKEKLKPIFNVDELREKQKVIHKLIHLEYASQLLLAAQFNLSSVNPFEYVFRCLNTKLEILEEGEEEAQLILQYIHNGSRPDDYSKPPKVLRIFRVERAGEIERFRKCGIGNPWMLWHGTNSINLLSILHRGLKVTPLEANLSGHLFGKGIYFADMFTKSRGYCLESTPKHMFLCDVALGKIHPIKLHHWGSDSNKQLPPTCHSLKTVDSQYEPDAAATLLWKGRTVPLGRPVENILPEDQYHGLHYNEFIVFNEDQVNLRYLIQFEDK